MNYEQLPVYKDTYHLLIFIYQYTKRINRQYRYTLIEELKKACQEILIRIYEANTSEERVCHIKEAMRWLIRVRVLFRVLRDLNQLSERQIVQIIDKIASISKQLTAWHKYALKNAKKSFGS